MSESVETVVTELQKKPIVRRRRKKNTDPNKHYFNADTQAAIVEFCAETNKRAREKIYVTRIKPAFVKLVENLINIHKFTSLHDSQSDLRDDCVTYLFETMTKFDPSRGSNAFSYFNVVAKNLLVVKVKDKTQKMRRYVSLEDQMNQDDMHKVESTNKSFVDPSVICESKESKKAVVERLNKMILIMDNPYERVVIDAIKGLLESADDIDILGRSAAMMYMREVTGLPMKQLTSVIRRIKKRYDQINKWEILYVNNRR